MSFQGKLTNPDGTNVPDGAYSVRFRMYTDAVADAANPCGSNSCVWEETHGSVPVEGGIFHVSLGSLSSLSSVDFSTPPLYLAMKVGSDNEMTPRINLESSPFAINSDQLDGLDSGQFAQLGQGIQVDSSASTPSIGINKTGSGALAQLQHNGTTAFILQNNGSAQFFDDSGLVELLGTDAAAGTFSAGSGTLIVGSDGSITRNIGAGKSATNNYDSGSQSRFIASAQQTGDLLFLDNTGFAPTTNDANGFRLVYSGGNAAVEGAGIRIDYAPGGTSGGTWSGLRIVANSTGPASGVTSYGIKLEGPSSSTSGEAVGLGITSGFDIGLDIASGGIQLAAVTSEPSTPTGNNLRIYAQALAGRVMLKVKGPSGVDYSLQPAIFSNKIGWWTANGNSTTVNTINFNNSITGTATTRNVSTTNMLSATKRVSYVTAGTAGSSAGTRHNTAQYWLGNGAGLGGFYYVARFGVNTAPATTRVFVGLSATTGVLTNANPSAKFNQLAFACDAADSEFTFMHNDGSGTSTKETLTGSFPCNTSGTDLYDVRIFTPPNSSLIYYSILRVNTGDYFEGSTTTNVPGNTTLMSPQIWINNGTTAAAADISVISQYIETDN